MRGLAFVLTIAFSLAAPLTVLAQDAKVTVVAILASDRHTNVDSKLKAIADEVRKRDAALTGYRIERSTTETMTFNQKKTFPLVGDVTAEVTLVARDEKDKKIRLSIKAAHAGEITYTTVADKFFPVLTRYQTDKDKERLIFAVMVKPLTTPTPVEKPKEK